MAGQSSIAILLSAKQLLVLLEKELSISILYGHADFLLQQDLAPAHIAKNTRHWFADHGMTVHDWPANSPDLETWRPMKTSLGTMA